MFISINRHSQRGQSLIEVILASAIFSIFAVAFAFAFIYGQEATVLAGNRGRASLLAEEGLEAVRNIGDENFSNLQDGSYGLTIDQNIWQLSGGSDATGIFTRQIVIASVGDSTSTKEISSVVTWPQNSQRQGLISLTTRLNDWRGN